jgi:hypothetical protein
MLGGMKGSETSVLGTIGWRFWMLVDDEDSDDDTLEVASVPTSSPVTMVIRGFLMEVDGVLRCAEERRRNSHADQNRGSQWCWMAVGEDLRGDGLI